MTPVAASASGSDGSGSFASSHWLWRHLLVADPDHLFSV
jgi:hypothetical protein